MGDVELKLIMVPCVEELYIIKVYAVLIKITKIKGSTLRGLTKVKFIISISSAIKLKVGGAAIFDIKTKNHKRGNVALQPNTPLVNNKLREWFV